MRNQIFMELLLDVTASLAIVLSTSIVPVAVLWRIWQEHDKPVRTALDDAVRLASRAVLVVAVVFAYVYGTSRRVETWGVAYAVLVWGIPILAVALALGVLVWRKWRNRSKVRLPDQPQGSQSARPPSRPDDDKAAASSGGEPAANGHSDDDEERTERRAGHDLLMDRMSDEVLMLIGALPEDSDGETELRDCLDPPEAEALAHIEQHADRSLALHEADAGRGAAHSGIAVEIVESVAILGGATAAVREAARLVVWAYHKTAVITDRRPMVSLGTAEYLALADLCARVDATPRVCTSGDMNSNSPDRSFTGGDAFYVVLAAEADPRLHHYHITGYGEVIYVGESPPIRGHWEAPPPYQPQDHHTAEASPMSDHPSGDTRPGQPHTTVRPVQPYPADEQHQTPQPAVLASVTIQITSSAAPAASVATTPPPQQAPPTPIPPLRPPQPAQPDLIGS